MTDPRDTPAQPPVDPSSARQQRNDAAQSVTGRSAPIAEIGRELGELDFEPDDLLASLRPIDPGAIPEPNSYIEPSQNSKFRPPAAPPAPPATVGNLAASALGHPQFPELTSAPIVNSIESPAGRSQGPRSADFADPPSSTGFETAPSSNSPRTIVPPTLGHNLARASSISPPPQAELPADGPDVVAFEDNTNLESLIALPSERVGPLEFENEKSAVCHLDGLGLTATFADIAKLLHAESLTQRHPQERAELAVVASELFAMCNQKSAAQAVLGEVPSSTIPLHAAQSRQLAFDAGDLAPFAKLLRAELRASTAHESRRHLMALYAEVSRLVGTEDADLRRHLELSLRAFPTDSRFQLDRLATQLNDTKTTNRSRQVIANDCLGQAEIIRDLLALRTCVESGGESIHPVRPALAARSALRLGRHASTIEALQQLRKFSDFEPATNWLIIGFSLHSPDHRATVQALLETMLEQGDHDAELAWLEHRLGTPESRPSSVELFSLGVTRNLPVEDQLALAIAVGADTETVRLLVDTLTSALAQSPELLPWAHAVRQAVLKKPSFEGLAPEALSQWALGSSIGTPQEPRPCRPYQWDHPGLSLDTLLSVSQCESLSLEPTLCATLRLYHNTHGQSLTSIAASLLALLPRWQPNSVAFIQVLAALLFDLDGNRGESQSLLRECLSTSPGLEVVARALAAQSTDTVPPPALDNLVGQIDAGVRRDLLYFEQCVRNGSLDDISRHPGPANEAGDAPAHDGVAQELQPLAALLRSDPHHWRTLLSRSQESTEKQLLAYLSHDSAFGSDAPLVDSELAPSEGWLDTIAQARQSIDERPMASTVDSVAWLGQTLQSPSAKRLAESFSDCLPPAFERFETRFASAIRCDDTSDFLHQLLLASFADPEREVGVGSVRAALAASDRLTGYLPPLRTQLVSVAAVDGLAQVCPSAREIAVQLEPQSAASYAWLSWVGAVEAGTGTEGLSASLGTVLTLAESEARPADWGIRRLLVHERISPDPNRYLLWASVARKTSTSALDAATLALRGAEAALKLEQWDTAESLLDEAVTLVPDHLVALSMRAEYQEARNNATQAADAFEALARASCMPHHKVAAWLHAAELHATIEAASTEQARLIACLEQAVELDPHQEEAQLRLRELYRSKGRLESLERLLTQQLLLADSPEVRAKLEVERAEVLLQLDRRDEAKGGLERALSLIPDHADTLVLYSRLLEEQGEGEEAERHLLTLAGTTTDEGLSLYAYRHLAELYETVLEQPARAEIAYREVLKRQPGDAAGDRLVQILLREGMPGLAVEVLLQLIEHSVEATVERNRNLELARIYDAILGDQRRAEEILEKARRKYAQDPFVLKAQAEFFERARDHAAYSTLLERSVTEARRALASGRFEPNFFEVIAMVGSLRDSPDTAAVATATLHALSGAKSSLSGIGTLASDERFADSLAPEVLSLQLRALLRRTGVALSATAPLDLRAMRATALSEHSPKLTRKLTDLSHEFGMKDLNVYLSPALGTVCQPASNSPNTLLVGPGFVALQEEQVRDALAIRALRILSANATAFANTSPVELWPLLAAYLTAHLPDYMPASVDAKRVEQLRAPMLKILPSPLDHDLPMLAADVVASIGNRASQLGVAAQQWGSRTALLALGDPSYVLMAIASASGQTDKITGSAADRLKWILRNPEARDIAVFSVSEAYLAARARA